MYKGCVYSFHESTLELIIRLICTDILPISAGREVKHGSRHSLAIEIQKANSFRWQIMINRFYWQQLEKAIPQSRYRQLAFMCALLRVDQYAFLIICFIRPCCGMCVCVYANHILVNVRTKLQNFNSSFILIKDWTGNCSNFKSLRSMKLLQDNMQQNGNRRFNHTSYLTPEHIWGCEWFINGFVCCVQKCFEFSL